MKIKVLAVDDNKALTDMIQEYFEDSKKIHYSCYFSQNFEDLQEA